MKQKNSLRTYQKKRNFTLTPEPSGKKNVIPYYDNLFVIQHHCASHDHYDFRFVLGGVLKSWAIPKGPSYNPTVKRLAIRTEDHPYAYAFFEGVIPEGEYGGGTVMVWDIGTYKNSNQNSLSLDQALKDGHVEIILQGQKMKGAFALIRTHFAGKEQWLFIKMKDRYASARKNPITGKPQSALTHRTMQQITKAGRP